MSNAGRKRLPTKLKVLKGTAKKSRMLKSEMTPDQESFLPPPPEGLNDFGKAAWMETGSVLVDLGIITKLDHNLLFAYCMEWGKYLDYEKQLRELSSRIVTAPSGYMMPHPLVAMAKDALKSAKDIAVQFGFTPSSRGRIAMPKSKDKKQSPQTLLKAI